MPNIAIQKAALSKLIINTEMHDLNNCVASTVTCAKPVLKWLEPAKNSEKNIVVTVFHLNTTIVDCEEV